MSGKVKDLGQFFDTPVQVKGASWLPVTQGIVWVILTRSTIKRSPELSTGKAVREGFLKMLIMLGSEWCHNIAHVLAAYLVGKPMDGFRIQLGMPRCYYRELNPVDVTPGQHLIRAAGGPIASAALFGVSQIIQPVIPKNTSAYRTLRTAVQTNRFLSLISLLPIPGIDGGPILKWGLVKSGASPADADRIVQKVNGPLAVLLIIASVIFLRKKRYFPGVFSGMLSLTSLLVFSGVIQEEEIEI